ncbi:MAG: VTT domain-containing protein [Actinomycetota bacterium]|nr:VTT domain-containing protein [Actinomycetota bacterium]
MSETRERPTPPSRRVLYLLLAPIIALTVAGTIGDWFAAAIINEHPLLQMFINPRSRYLALASNQIDTVPFYVVGFVRLVLTDPLFYLLGWFYGENALSWIEKRLGEDGSLVRSFERFFSKAAYPIVLFAPNGYICAMAGMTGMRPPVFMVLNVVGTVTRLIVIRQTAAVLESPLQSVLDFIQRYQWWIVGFSIAMGVWQLTGKWRKGEKEIEPLSEMADELEGQESDESEPAG